MVTIKCAQSCNLLPPHPRSPFWFWFCHTQSTIHYILISLLSSSAWLLLAISVVCVQTKWKTFVVIEYLWTGNVERFLGTFAIVHRHTLVYMRRVLLSYVAYRTVLKFQSPVETRSTHSHAQLAHTEREWTRKGARKFPHQPQNNNGTRIFSANYAEINNGQECATHTHTLTRIHVES